MPGPCPACDFAALHHLLGHGLRALAQPVEREALLLRGAVEIALADRLLGVAHGLLRALELVGRLAALDAEAVDQALQPVAKLLLTLAELGMLADALTACGCWPISSWPLLARRALAAAIRPVLS